MYQKKKKKEAAAVVVVVVSCAVIEVVVTKAAAAVTDGYIMTSQDSEPTKDAILTRCCVESANQEHPLKPFHAWMWTLPGHPSPFLPSATRRWVCYCWRR
jgi:tRNA A37 methylthiotransferase MiaB